MRWNTTNTALANRINNGNTFQETDTVTEGTLNAIIQELFNIETLVGVLRRL
ncbi:MAG: hypothetical protein FWE36_02515 [Erysipelotrichales bacterium]|nr:hypothetical protein [Erysipelotrichales bacterium]